MSKNKEEKDALCGGIKEVIIYGPNTDGLEDCGEQGISEEEVMQFLKGIKHSEN